MLQGRSENDDLLGRAGSPDITFYPAKHIQSPNGKFSQVPRRHLPSQSPFFPSTQECEESRARKSDIMSLSSAISAEEFGTPLNLGLPKSSYPASPVSRQSSPRLVTETLLTPAQSPSQFLRISEVTCHSEINDSIEKRTGSRPDLLCNIVYATCNQDDTSTDYTASDYSPTDPQNTTFFTPDEFDTCCDDWAAWSLKAPALLAERSEENEFTCRLSSSTNEKMSRSEGVQGTRHHFSRYREDTLFSAARAGDVAELAELLHIRHLHSPRTSSFETRNPVENACTENKEDPALKTCDQCCKGKWQSTPLMCAASGRSKGHLACAQLLIDTGEIADMTCTSGHSALFAAAKSGSFNMVELLLNHGADVTRYCQHHFTPLLIAAKAASESFPSLVDCRSVFHPQDLGSSDSNFAGVIKLLLSQGADISACSGAGLTAIEYAAQCRDEQVAATLITFLNRMESCDMAEKAVSMAVKKENSKVLQLLLEMPGVMHKSIIKEQLLMTQASSNGDVASMKVLLEAGADVKATGPEGRQPLHAAAAAPRNSAAAVKFLLSTCRNKNVRDCKNRTPLMWAAISGNARAAAVLAEHGADINAFDHDGMSALHHASSSGSVECTLTLLNNGAKVNLHSRKGARRTPLFLAAAAACPGTVHALLRAGAVVNTVDAHGCTPLLYACESACASTPGDAILLLLEAGACIRRLNSSQETPMFVACRTGFYSGVRIFSGSVGEVHCRRRRDGSTPLMVAAEEGHGDVVKLLLEVGSLAKYQRLCDGMSALMVAAARGHDQVLRHLIAAGVDVTDRDQMGMTALHFAALNGAHKVVDRLVFAGAYVDSRNARGATPLILATQSGDNDTVLKLLQAGANPGLKDFLGSTAAEFAARKGNVVAWKWIMHCAMVLW